MKKEKFYVVIWKLTLTFHFYSNSDGRGGGRNDIFDD